MVFCYKTITESPSRTEPDATSSRHQARSVRSPVCRVPIYLSSISQFLDGLDSVQSPSQSSIEVIDSIPKREWRLLAAVAKKKERDDEQRVLSDQLRRLWEKEKEERKVMEAETSEQYKSYINSKRRQERMCNEHRRYERAVSAKEKTEQLSQYIRFKEMKSADVLAVEDGRKASQLVSSSMVSDARAQLAAARRRRACSVERRRRETDLQELQRRVDDARERRSAKLRDASKRVAITNALSDWESSMLRQEQEAMEAAQRASTAAHAAATAARGANIKRSKEQLRKRARKMADVTQQLREAVRGCS